MLVIDKPAGLAVHRGPNGGESLEDHFDALRFGLPRAPALAHRLDRDTSGCLVLGRHRKALAKLGRLFKSGAVGKTYWAVVEGTPDAAAGVIELPLGRLDETRGWWMKHDPEGQPAVTKWKVLGPSSPRPCEERSEMGVAKVGTPVDTCGRSAARARARSISLPPCGGGQGGGSAGGATHQLRVHCAEMGWPILGDAIYGSAPRSGGPPLHLHAREIIVPLYKNRAPILVAAPVPPHMRARLEATGWNGEGDSSLPRREHFADSVGAIRSQSRLSVREE
jgi:tRNA pseudouridine32 synthase/23S rRNA pseudouridine746 synthase